MSIEFRASHMLGSTLTLGHIPSPSDLLRQDLTKLPRLALNIQSFCLSFLNSEKAVHVAQPVLLA